MEKESKKHEEASPILQEPDIKRFIEKRGIRSEDFGVIEELAVFPNELIIELVHNLFNTNRERSADALRQSIEFTKDKDRQRLYKLFQKFYAIYGWATCYNLVGILEERKGTPTLLRWELERNKD